MIRNKDKYEAQQLKAESGPSDVNVTTFEEISFDEFRKGVTVSDIRKELNKIDNIYNASAMSIKGKHRYIKIIVTTTEVFNDNESYDSQMTDFESKLDVKVNDILHSFCN